MIITQLADECCFVHVDCRLNKGIQYIMCSLIEMSKHQAELTRIHANNETMQRDESYPHDVLIVKNTQRLTQHLKTNLSIKMLNSDA